MPGNDFSSPAQIRSAASAVDEAAPTKFIAKIRLAWMVEIAAARSGFAGAQSHSGANRSKAAVENFWDFLCGFGIFGRAGNGFRSSRNGFPSSKRLSETGTVLIQNRVSVLVPLDGNMANHIIQKAICTDPPLCSKQRRSSL